MTVQHTPGTLIPLAEVEPGYLIQRPDSPLGDHRLRVIARVSQTVRGERRRWIKCADGEVPFDLPVRDGAEVLFVEDGLAGQERTEAAVWELIERERGAA
jgi:hypothetical protein